MANSFLGLTTNSTGEERSGDYWQSNRAKDGFYKVSKAGYNGPDAARTDGSESPAPDQADTSLVRSPEVR